MHCSKFPDQNAGLAALYVCVVFSVLSAKIDDKILHSICIEISDILNEPPRFILFEQWKGSVCQAKIKHAETQESRHI